MMGCWWGDCRWDQLATVDVVPTVCAQRGNRHEMTDSWATKKAQKWHNLRAQPKLNESQPSVTCPQGIAVLVGEGHGAGLDVHLLKLLPGPEILLRGRPPSQWRDGGGFSLPGSRALLDPLPKACSLPHQQGGSERRLEKMQCKKKLPVRPS